MKPKMKIKIGIDFLMTVLLLLLMSYQITGQELHEWFGVGMFVLFILHNILNMKWYQNFFRGKYRIIRIIQTIINFSVLLSMLCLGFSGVVMSRYVFAVLSIHGPMATARSMHMAASYWGFVLMGIHLGLHWGIVTGIFRSLLQREKLSGIFLCTLRLLAVLIAVYGFVCFVRKDIVSYMFLKNQFVFFDFEQGVVLVLAEYSAIMGFWIFAGFCITKWCGKNPVLRLSRKEIDREKN